VLHVQRANTSGTVHDIVSTFFSGCREERTHKLDKNIACGRDIKTAMNTPHGGAAGWAMATQNFGRVGHNAFSPITGLYVR